MEKVYIASSCEPICGDWTFPDRKLCLEIWRGLSIGSVTDDNSDRWFEGKWHQWVGCHYSSFVIRKLGQFKYRLFIFILQHLYLVCILSLFTRSIFFPTKNKLSLVLSNINRWLIKFGIKFGKSYACFKETLNHKHFKFKNISVWATPNRQSSQACVHTIVWEILS